MKEIAIVENNYFHIFFLTFVDAHCGQIRGFIFCQ